MHVLPPNCKVLKAPHRIPPFTEVCPLDFNLGIVSSAKKDGNRGLCVCGQLFTSSMDPPANPHLLDLLAPMIERSTEDELMFDYELYDPAQSHHGATAGSINSSVNIDGKLSPTLAAYVFDCAPISSFVHECVDEQFGLRIQRYTDEVRKIQARGSERIFALEQRRCNTLEDCQRYFQNDLDAGDEGSMLRALEIHGDPGDRRKLRGGWYKHGRATYNQHIIYKLKNYVTIDGVIVDVHQREELVEDTARDYDSNGHLVRPVGRQHYRPAESVGSFEVSYRNNNGALRRSRVGFGSGFSLFERELLWQQHKGGRSLIGRWCEFSHMPNGVKDDGNLRIGQLKRFRDDRAGEQL